MICLKSNSNYHGFPLNMLFRISFIERSGTNTEVCLRHRNNLPGHDDDSLGSHSLYWKIDTIPAITAGALG